MSAQEALQLCTPTPEVCLFTAIAFMDKQIILFTETLILTGYLVDKRPLCE